MTHPTIHLNGTAGVDLLGATQQACRALQDALVALDETASNARDYYVQGDDAFRKAADEHRARRDAVTKVLRDMEERMENLVDQMEARGQR